MLLYYALLLLANARVQFDIELYAERWSSWKLKHGKEYATLDEDSHRMNIFISNLQEIESWNENPSDNFTKAMNHFGDLTASEWKSLVSCQFPDEFLSRGVVENEMLDDILINSDVNASVDWATKDCGDGPGSCLTPAKDQGQCGSCWAFGATGAMESLWASEHGELYSLSEQELVDCTYGSPYDNHGCQGGVTDFAYDYAVDEEGLCSESEYPYTAKDGTCRTCGSRYIPITGWTGLQRPVSEETLKTTLSLRTVSGAVEADQVNFQFYHAGVVTASCGTSLDHSILVVGYGTDEERGGIDYWKIKNSWGQSWGEDGYLRICRGCDANGDDGQCGIYMGLAYPTL